MRIRLKPLPERASEDMIRIDDEQGIAYALVCRDLFWKGPGQNSEIYEALKLGEEVLVELSIIEE